MIKEVNPSESCKIYNHLHNACNSRPPKYINQNLTELKGEMK